MSKMFQYKVSHHQRTDTLYTDDAPDLKRNTCSKISPFNLPFLGVKSSSIKSSTVYSLSGVDGDHMSY